MRPGERQYRLPHWALGLIVVAATILALLLGFARELPWGGGYEIKAVFNDVQGLKTNTPVRIAGIEVGRVTGVESLAAAGSEAATGSGADGATPTAVVVTMEIEDEGRPIHSDATLRLRPRLFLEGNYFVDLRPGSPGAPEAASGELIPATNTASPVQLDQVLTTLQSDVRQDLRTLLDELGGSLVTHGGAAGLRTLYRTSPGAFRSTARVADALLGTEPHDLSGAIRNLDRVLAALDRRAPQLQSLVTRTRVVTGALAAEAAALERAVAELPATIDAAQPVLAALNASFPQVRAFAREALPGVAVLPPAIDAATPLLHQVRGLVSRRELRGAVADLRPAIPWLAKLARRSVPFLRQARALASCFNETVIPWSNMTVPDPETPATARIFEELGYGLVGIAGESRSGDANGPYARVLGGGGTNTVVFPPFGGETQEIVGVAPDLLGARPSLASSAKTPFRPDVACETNAPPNLDSGAAEPPPALTPASTAAPAQSPELRAGLRALAARFERLDGSRSGADAAEDAVTDLNELLAQAYGWEALMEVGGP
jgi:virulence factor Mce-like protein